MEGFPRIWLEDDARDHVEPADGWMFVGVIEWGSDSAEGPAITAAHTVEEVERWYRNTVAEALQLEDGEPVPPPRTATDAEIRQWMEEWREATTEAWLTVVRRPILPVAELAPAVQAYRQAQAEIAAHIAEDPMRDAPAGAYHALSDAAETLAAEVSALFPAELSDAAEALATEVSALSLPDLPVLPVLPADDSNDDVPGPTFTPTEDGGVRGTVVQRDERGDGPFHGAEYHLCGKAFTEDGESFDCTNDHGHDGPCSQ